MHIKKNLKELGKCSDEDLLAFDKVAYATTLGDYETALDDFRDTVSTRSWDYFMKSMVEGVRKPTITPIQWSLYHSVLPTTNNSNPQREGCLASFSETYYSSINKTRDAPLQYIHEALISKEFSQLAKILENVEANPLAVSKMCEANITHAKYLHKSDFRFEKVRNENKFKVTLQGDCPTPREHLIDVDKKTCSQRCEDMNGVPCVQAFGLCYHQLQMHPNDFVATKYHKTYVIRVLKAALSGRKIPQYPHLKDLCKSSVPIKCNWVHKQAGRPKTRRATRKSAREAAARFVSTALKKSGSYYRNCCSICGDSSHNCNTCFAAHDGYGNSMTAKQQTEGSLNEILSDIQKLEKTEIKNQNQVVYDELFFSFLFWGIIFFVFGELSRRFALKEVA
jgi:hypothetical protein